MSDSSSVLGPLENRKKEDVRVPENLREIVGKLSRVLGVPKNAFYVLAAGYFALRYAPMVTSARSRDSMIDALEAELREILKEIRKAS